MSDSDTVIVRIEQGDLRGKKVNTNDGLTYYSFQGIPYAKPPIGSLRFKAAEPPESWTGVRDALSLGNVALHFDIFKQKLVGDEDCLFLNVYIPQATKPPESWTGVRDALSLGNVALHFDIFKQKLVGDEDCLFLNVYTPQLSPSTPIPVMVWIHGGGYIWGSGNTDIYGPQPLMREGVILVTFNYRLGVLGFLDVRHSEVSLNNGLKDQVAALKWVQNNIKQFGGDLNNVTLFGESAGSFSVHHHILSPMSAGLFHKAIAMSGSALCSIALPQPNPQKAIIFAKEVGYDGDSVDELVKFLRKLPADTIASVGSRLMRTSKTYMGAVIEEPGPNAFIVEEPLNRIRSGNFNRVHIMAGMTSAEGKLYFLIPMQSTPLSDFNDIFDTLLPSNLKLEPGTEKAKEIAKKVKEFYFGEKELSLETREKFIEFYGDEFLAYGVYELVREHVKMNSPVFYYKFSYEGKFGFISFLGKTAPGPGAGHGDELFYLFESDEVDNNHKPGSPEQKVSANIAKLWANFAKYGNPSKDLNVDWIPATEENKWYLDINTELSLHKDIFKERMNFWEEIYHEVLGNR